MSDLLWIEIDLKKIKENILNIQKYAKKKLIPIIKSNAYNLGDLELMKLVKELDLDYAAVVDLNEALALLKHDANYKILILNSIEKHEYAYLNEFKNLAISINRVEDIQNLEKQKITRNLKVHIQIDTGMNRHGFNNIQNFEDGIEKLKLLANVEIEGLYTHFSSLKKSFVQLNIFKGYVEKYPFKIIHLAASSTYKQLDFGNYVRVGLDMYGSTKENQAIKVACYPLSINDVLKGQTIGYDETYKAKKDMKVAVLPIGYANGFRRDLKGSMVMVYNKLYKTIGNVCMNHLFVQVDDDVNLNSEFIITSPDHPIEEMAKHLHTIPHEILCMLNIKTKKYIR